MKNNTLAIKAAAYNQIQRVFNPSDRLYDMSSQQKLRAIRDVIEDKRQELYEWRVKRKFRRGIQRARLMRGYIPKYKTTLAEWQMMKTYEEVPEEAHVMH